MRVMIVGGGKVGYYMAKTLLDHGHQPIVIEKDRKLCNQVANDLDIPVTQGDGSTVEYLEAAGCGRCQALVAVTGRDEVNLITCQIAKRVFHVEKTVARVNNPKNTEVLRRLGVDIAVSSTDNLARILEREVETAAIQQVLNLAGGTATVFEIQIPDRFKYNGKSLAQIPISESAVIIAITRAGELLIPRGNTQILNGDKVLCVARDTAIHELMQDWGLANG
ncbi:MULTISPECIES: TrkA family potassium uptake protein [Allofournierella]|uniref:Trk system potassium uptake protein TrkA n=1 Tax=Allofournierella massiliensis TaxID=1650663 RepID=A0ABT7UQM7_9FIRM|nr:MULTISPECIES: TrkA family potassium uptake protein [Fournierella]MDM8201194.1 TrkA family potassium uptake protein [Fournierella massiliensis]OUN17210.1 potassium transporter TrkA [Gemmiger sp. An87]